MGLFTFAVVWSIPYLCWMHWLRFSGFHISVSCSGQFDTTQIVICVQHSPCQKCLKMQFLAVLICIYGGMKLGDEYTG